MPDGTGVRDGLTVMDRAEAHGWALAWLKRHERKLRLNRESSRSGPGISAPLAPARPAAGFRLHHISTDEVFGSLQATGRFCETTPYDPCSPC